MPEICVSLGRRITFLRKERKLRQGDLATATHLSRTYLAEVEAGRQNIGIVGIERIANGLGVSVATLFDDTAFHTRSASEADVYYRDQRHGGLVRADEARRAPDARSTILAALRADTDATIARLAKATGFSHAKVERTLAELKAAGDIAREGTRRSGRWTLLRDGNESVNTTAADTGTLDAANEEDVRVRLGKRIRELRAERGLAQDALAYAIGMERTHLINIEAGRRNVPIVTVGRLARGLGTPVSTIFCCDAFRAVRDIERVVGKEDETAGNDVDALLSFLREHPAASLAEAARALGLTQAHVEREVVALKAAGTLRHVGPRRGGRWESS